MRRAQIGLFAVCLSLLCELFFVPRVFPQSRNPEWDRLVEAAKKEGKVVVSLPASNELRAAIERLFENRYGIDVEPIVGRAATVVRKMIDEAKAGVRYTDLHMGGSESVVTGMLPEGIVDPLEPYMMLPEVKDPKQWWGGHIWVDNAKKFVYGTLAYQPESLWFNSQLMKAEDVRLTASDGTKLHAWFLPASGPAKGTVLHLHGNAANVSNHDPRSAPADQPHSSAARVVRPRATSNSLSRGTSMAAMGPAGPARCSLGCA